MLLNNQKITEREQESQIVRQKERGNRDKITDCMLLLSVNSIQFSRSVVSDSVTPRIAARQASLSITNSRSSLRLASIESMMSSSYLILCHPLLLLPPIPPSIRVNSSHEVAKLLEFQL